jgi:hypothetical protein
MPMDPLVSGSGTGSQDSVNYGMTLAAMSQYAKTLGMSSSSAMVTAMMSDAADGTFDGKMFSDVVMMGGMGMGTGMPSTAGTSGLGAAMLAFINNSALNKSGVAAATMQTLMSQLNGSSGQMMGSAGTGTSNGMMSGGVFNGPMSQGTVTAYAVAGGMKGAQLASTAIGATGAFSMSIGTYSGPVMLQVSGGSYTDEATGTLMTMGSSGVMTAVVPRVAAGATTAGIWVTPLSSMAQAHAAGMAGGMTDANINSANTGVGSFFHMVGDLLHTMPMDPRVAGSGAAATPDQQDCGVAIAAMSQYAQGISMPMSSGFVTAMMSDASDGMMDGKAGSTQIMMGGGMMGGTMMDAKAGTAGLATAMTSFLGSNMNLSGLTATSMNALIQKLAASNGQL